MPRQRTSLRYSAPEHTLALFECQTIPYLFSTLTDMYIYAREYFVSIFKAWKLRHKVSTEDVTFSPTQITMDNTVDELSM